MAVDYKLAPPANQAASPWLTAEQAGRVKHLAELRLLFAGRHKDYFFTGNRTAHEFKAAGPNASKVLYITENLAGRCTLKFADLLFGEPLVIESDDGDAAVDAAIARISEASELQVLLFDAAVTASWAGRAWWQLLAEGGAVRIEAVPPEHVFPRYAPGSRRLVAAEVIYPLVIDGKRYLRTIIHTVGQVEHKLVRLDDRTGRPSEPAPLDLVQPGLQPAQATGIDELTILELPNYSTGGPGATDYDGESPGLIDEINNRRSQISRVLDVHADPAVWALEELFEKDGTLKASGRALLTREARPPMGYVTWSAQLEEAFRAMVSAAEAWLGHMEVAPALIGWGGQTSADGYMKLRLLVGPTLARINRKRIHMAPGVGRAFWVAQLLEQRFAPLGVRYKPGKVSLTWGDSLPEDTAAKMLEITGYRRDGLLSRRRALMWLHSDPDIVEEELKELAAEAEASLPTSLRGGAFGLDRDEGGGNPQETPEGGA